MEKNQEIIIIAAMSENRVIGKNNALPWSIKADMLHFRELTGGYPCIMGRKTYQSLPKRPLPHRENIVISASLKDGDDKVKVFHSLEEGINYCKNYDKVFICGGGSIYNQALLFANKMELTLIHKIHEGDTYFPEIDTRYWVQTNRICHDVFSFITLSKRTELIPAKGALPNT
jgi:dihydrofolate reductase